MQDRYAGDIGDYVKLGLLRALSPKRKLGVAWYLHPDQAHNSDGRHIAYLDDPVRWRKFDPILFDALKRVVRSNRSIASIERSGVVPARFHRSPVVRSQGCGHTHESFRLAWFQELMTTLSGCDTVFADPDNGLVDDAPNRRRHEKHGKQMPLREALALAEGRTAIVYHHNSRFKGGHDLEVQHWLKQLGHGTLAVRANAYSCRTFFILNPDRETAWRAAEFCKNWSQARVRLHSACRTAWVRS